jgi:hypothetical protein
MAHCVQSGIVTAACTACGGRAEKMHQPVFHRGTFCPKCCPVCGENAVAAPPTQQAPLRGVVSASAVKRRPTAPTQGTSQFRDDGWGHRPNDPWVHDRERHQQSNPRWVPLRPNWFG